MMYAVERSIHVAALSAKQQYLQFLTSEYGADSYQSFRRLFYSDEDTLARWLADILQEEGELWEQDSLRIVDVGGGDGERTFMLLNSFQMRPDASFDLTFIEQSPSQYQRFLKRAYSTRISWQGHNALFEDVDLGSAVFDLVLLVHSIFAFEDNLSLEKVIRLRKNPGRILVASNAADSFLGRIKKLVDSEQYEKRYEINRLEAELASLRIPFRKVATTTKWSVRRHSWRREVTPLLDWITMGEFFSMNSEKKKELLSFVYENSEVVSDRMFFQEQEVALLI